MANIENYVKFLWNYSLKDGLKQWKSHISFDTEGYNIESLNVALYINKLSKRLFLEVDLNFKPVLK